MQHILSSLQVLGGLGVFLIGMIVMTDALRSLTGDAVHRGLVKLTKDPVSGVAMGAASTALLQSSSATTVAAVGFVGAGLISFPSALGIVFGANLGTTITGWIVTIVGFKFKLVGVLYPCILVGAILKLFGSGRLATVGFAVAGFGLIFVGIEQMQFGLQSMQELISSLDLPTDSHIDRLKLLGIGVVFTAITQSSSAGVAAVLTGLFTEAITVTQGLSLVVGMDIGTTLTAALAAVGGGTGSRRTGLSHVIYNLITGVIAFLLISPYASLLENFAPAQLVTNPEVVVVAFHTGFNLLGVLCVIPFTGQFARMMERLIPADDNVLTAALDKKLIPEPLVAIGAVRAALATQLALLFEQTVRVVDSRSSSSVMNELQHAIDDTFEYAAEIRLASDARYSEDLVSLFHILDHMQRLLDRCKRVANLGADVFKVQRLQEFERQLQQVATRAGTLLSDGCFREAENELNEQVIGLREIEHPFRAEVMRDLTSGDIDVREADDLLDRIRWLHRVSQHLRQIVHYMNVSSNENHEA